MSESDNTKKSAPLTPKSQSALGTPLAIVLAGVIIAGAIMFSGDKGAAPIVVADNQPPVVEQKTEEELLKFAEIVDGDHVRGNRNADVYILEFSDTECPFCKRFHETMQQVMAEYGGEVAWVYRHFPLAQLHSKATREAEATECAAKLGGEDIFWAYTDRIYEITPSNDGLEDSKLPEIAGELGLDVAAFNECLNDGEMTEEVAKDFQNAVDLGGTGTPHSLIVTKDSIIPIRGAQPFDVVKSSLDAVLAK